MPLLLPTEYDASYFDGRSQPTRHNAGYSSYERWVHENEGVLTDDFKEMAAGWINHLAISGKKVLEIGCAKGFLVKDLRDAGVDAWGIDVSSYAIGQCEQGMSPYLRVADARVLSTLGYARNEFDVLITSRFLECLSDAEVTAFLSAADFISRKQVHITTPPGKASSDFYNVKTAQQWMNGFPWRKGSVFAEIRSQSFLTK